jgi:hypothetical protein
VDYEIFDAIRNYIHILDMDPKLLTDGTILLIVSCLIRQKKSKMKITNKPQMAHIGSWEIDIDQQKYFWSDEVHSYMKQILKLLYLRYKLIEFYKKDFQELVKNSIEKCISDGAPFDFLKPF